MCKRIFVQFGDDSETLYAAFSGVFVQTDEIIKLLVTYIEERRKGNPGEAGRIAYCKSDKAWELYLDEELGPCNWVARSPETETFDVATTAASNWLTRNPQTKQTIAYSSFHLACNDCIGSELCPSEHATCEDNVCVCNQDRFGISCEF